MTLDNAPLPNTFEIHGPQPTHQEGIPLPVVAPKPSTGTLLGRSFLLGGPAGALIGLSTGVIALASTFLDPVMGVELRDGRWLGLVAWLAIGGLFGAILGAITGVIVGPVLVLLRIQRLSSAAAGAIAVVAALFVRRLLFGLAWIDFDNAWLLGDAVAAGLAAAAAFVVGKAALMLLTPKAA